MKFNSPIADRARSLAEVGLWKPALDLLQEELDREPDQGELLITRSRILGDQGDWPAALAAVETASFLIPLDLESQLHLAECHLRVGNRELSLVAYEDLLSNRALPVGAYDAVYEAFQELGEHESALQACRSAIAFDPYNDRAYFRMALCMSELAYPPKQITAVLCKAVDLDPDNVQYRSLLAVQLSLTKRRTEAYSVLAARDHDELAAVSCPCMARKLLEICVWAGDIQRASCLGGLLARLNVNKLAVSEA